MRKSVLRRSGLAAPGALAEPAAALLTNAKTRRARSSRGFSADALRAVIGLMSIGLPASAYAQTPDLGSAANFAVLAGSTVTNTGSTVLRGSLGLSPGSAVTGFPPGIVLAPGGTFISDAVAIQAQVDLVKGYNAVASRPATSDLTGQNLGGLTLTPGVYNFASSAQLTGTLTSTLSATPTQSLSSISEVRLPREALRTSWWLAGESAAMFTGGLAVRRRWERRQPLSATFSR
jgi:hypothetical protein